MRSLFVVVLLAKVASGGACPPRDPVASTLTPIDTELAADGGVIVAVEPAAGNHAAKLTLEYAAGVAPVTHVLAPGLTVYETPASGSALAFAGTAFRRAAKAPPVLPAPSVARVVYTNTNRPNVTEISVTSTLKSGVPATAIAIVVFGVDKGVTTPRSFARVAAKATTLTVYHNPPKCDVDAPGTIATAAGDHVAFAWVDAAGRLGKVSSTLTVSSVKP